MFRGNKGKKRAARLLLSGGLDSTAALAFLSTRGFEVETVFIDHGQLARERERRAAKAIAQYYRVPHEALSFEHSCEFQTGEIPGRNSFLLFASLITFRKGSGVLAIGVHAGTPYFDCSETFINDTDQAIAEQTNGRVRVIAPFITWLKADVYNFGLQNSMPINLTYSCEAGDEPCHSCASCRDREQLSCLLHTDH